MGQSDNFILIESSAASTTLCTHFILSSCDIVSESCHPLVPGIHLCNFAVMIELGLSRITRLCRNTPIPWRAIHVAGTNGKGSVCAYASAMLHAGNIKCGRFTSPHLIDRWDCITIDEKPVSSDIFHEIEATVKTKDLNDNIKASEFELLTATAFEIFNREKIEVGIIEVGLGGRHDATNILQHPCVTVITRIGKDHEAFLGDTLEEIAYQKAGIMKQGTPCLVDSSNPENVLNILEQAATDSEVSSFSLISQDSSKSSDVWRVLEQDSYQPHQQRNICLAYEAVIACLSRFSPHIDPLNLLPAIRQVVWPGRLQVLSIASLGSRRQTVLLDGAHNPQSADVLGSYVDSQLRVDEGPVTWVIAISKGKSVQDLLSPFVLSKDNIIAVEFGPVDGMPLIQPEAVQAIIAAGKELGVSGELTACTSGLLDSLVLASELAKEGPMVIAGSLYLVSDILRLLKQAGMKTA